MSEVSRTLNAGGMGRQDWETETLIPTNGGGFDVAHSLRGDGFDASEDGTGRGTPLVATAFAHQAGGTQTTLGYDPDSRTSPTLAKCQTPAVTVSPSLTAYNMDSRSPQSEEQQHIVGAVYKSSMQVRRLTPRECERLQGFPDDYTLVQHRNKPAADGPRYKALGNSMAVPVMAWIGRRIAMVEQLKGESNET